MIKITYSDFSIDEVIEKMRRKEIGAIVVFVGIVRGQTKERTVKRLEVEAYKDMTIRQLKSIREKAKQDFNVSQIAIIHRLGSLKVTDNIMLIAVGAAHRDEAFKACRFILEQIKTTVPVWKKEFTSEGSYWVKGEKE